jgi:hypothetical protein
MGAEDGEEEEEEEREVQQAQEEIDPKGGEAVEEEQGVVGWHESCFSVGADAL